MTSTLARERRRPEPAAPRSARQGDRARAVCRRRALARHAARRHPHQPARARPHRRLSTRRGARRCPACRRSSPAPTCRARRSGGIVKDETMLARGKVRYVGEPVAAVAAIDAETARARPRPHRGRLRAAAARCSRSTRRWHRTRRSCTRTSQATSRRVDGGGARQRRVRERPSTEGDVDAAFAECDVIVEGTSTKRQAQQHVYLETNGCVADVDADGRITLSCDAASRCITCSSASPRSSACRCRKIRAIATRVGGGFGGKHASNMHSIAAWLARATRRPVKLVLVARRRTSRSSARAIRRASGCKTGARRDGTIVARDVRITLDGGAYADESPAVLAFALLMSRGPYRIAERARAAASAVYTNKLRAGSFRGFGNPQASFAGESQIDELAAKLGIDPVELRLQATRCGRATRRSAARPVPSCVLARVPRRARSRLRSAQAPPLPPRAGWRRGIGVRRDRAHLRPDGHQRHRAAAHRRHRRAQHRLRRHRPGLGHGDGADLRRRARRADRARRATRAQDTDVSPYNWKTAGSRSTYMTGRAVAVATRRDARARCSSTRAEIFECAAADLELRAGRRWSASRACRQGRDASRTSRCARCSAPAARSPARTASCSTARLRSQARARSHRLAVRQSRRLHVRRALRRGRRRRGHRRGRGAPRVVRARRRPGDQSRRAAKARSRAASCRASATRSTEAMHWNDEGWLTTATLADYKIPGVLDLPPEIHPIVLEDPEPTHPVGAKGVGEPSLVGVAPAIANAISQCHRRAPAPRCR